MGGGTDEGRGGRFARAALIGAFSAAALSMPIFARPSASAADVAAKALAFKASLDAGQRTALERPYTEALARRWSNLPVGSAPRNGVRFADLSPAQLALAFEVIAAAAGKGPGQGYDEFIQTTRADSIIGVSQPNAYGKGLYFIAFLNAPSAAGAWMLQYGGHHYAQNIAYRNGAVIGGTPAFRGIEPTTFTPAGGSPVSLLKADKDAFADLIASLSAGEKAAARIPAATDLTAGAGKDGAFPAAKAGIRLSALTAAQRDKALAAVGAFAGDLDSASEGAYRDLYRAELGETYFAWSGSGAFSATYDYARLDGPSLWIEFFSPAGVFVRDQVHYHAVWRDRTRDYGKDLLGEPVPAGAKARRGRTGFRAGPAGGDGRLSLELGGPVRGGVLTVSDLSGRSEWMRRRIEGERVALDVSALPQGAYLVRVQDAAGMRRFRFTRL